MFSILDDCRGPGHASDAVPRNPNLKFTTNPSQSFDFLTKSITKNESYLTFEMILFSFCFHFNGTYEKFV